MPTTYSSPIFAGQGGFENPTGPYQWNPTGSFGYGTSARGNATTALGAAGQAGAFNLSQSKNLGALSDLINSINVKAQQTALQARIPGEAGLEQQSSTNIGQQLAGQVPQDVMNLLQQQGAERGAATGQGGGSPNANAAYLRALGLTSIGQQQAGQQNLTAAEGRNPAAPIFDPSSQLLTPAQLASLNLGYINAGRRDQPTGGGGYGGVRTGYGGGPVNANPFQYAEPGMFAYGSPTNSTVSGNLTVPPQSPGAPPFDQAAWLGSLGYYGGNDIESGVRTSPFDYSQFGPGGNE